MDVYVVREYFDRGDMDHAYYTDRLEAKKHVKALRRYSTLTGDNERKNIVTVKLDIRDKFIPEEVPGSGFNPKYIKVGCDPINKRAWFAGFISEQEAADARISDVMLYIYSRCSTITRSWTITPQVVFYIPYVLRPYEQNVRRAEKVGERMIQRVNQVIDFRDYYGMNPWELHKAGWNLCDETLHRWETIMTNVEAYYKTDPNKPEVITLDYMYKCCPGPFNGTPISIYDWDDTAYKTLEQVESEYGHSIS